MNVRIFSTVLQKILLVLVCGLIIIICENCDDEPTRINDNQAETVLDIGFVTDTPEVFIGSSTLIKGTLTNSTGKMHVQKIFLSVVPDSVGNTSPPIFTFTDTSDTQGFSDRVTFEAIKVGNARINASYKVNDDVIAFAFIDVLVKNRGNE